MPAVCCLPMDNAVVCMQFPVSFPGPQASRSRQQIRPLRKALEGTFTPMGKDAGMLSLSYTPGGLQPSAMLANVLSEVPELRRFSNVDLQVGARLHGLAWHDMRLHASMGAGARLQHWAGRVAGPRCLWRMDQSLPLPPPRGAVAVTAAWSPTGIRLTFATISTSFSCPSLALWHALRSSSTWTRHAWGELKRKGSALGCI